MSDQVKQKDQVADGDPVDDFEVVSPDQVQLVPTPSRDVSLDLTKAESLDTIDLQVALFRRRAKAIEEVRRTCIEMTDPEHWILNRSPQGAETGMLTAAGADIVATFYGISVSNVRPAPLGIFEPVEVAGEDGEVGYRCWCSASSSLTGAYHEVIESFRSTSEDFSGRGAIDTTTKLVTKSDLRKASMTLLRTKAVRVLAGLSDVSRQTLEEAWAGTNKTAERCVKGSGFGDRTSRTASRVAEAGVESQATELWEELLRRTSGDEDAASGLLKDITANPPKFDGRTDYRTFTQGWQIKTAWKNLESHEVFGGPQK